MALIPPFFLDCVVAIGADTGVASPPQWMASGFFYGHLVKEDQGQLVYRTYLVSNKHVFQDQKHIWVRFNPQAPAPVQQRKLEMLDPGGKPLWVGHPDPEIDVAVAPIQLEPLRAGGVHTSFFHGEVHAATRAKAIELGLAEGDGAYALGFPMGLLGEAQNFVIVRQGGIARIRDALTGSSREILVDVPVFPGNSGGPVVTKPEITAIQGTLSQNSAYLIGVVKGYIPYRDVAISVQTRQTRVVFEENSGLAAVIPIDYVVEAIMEHMIYLTLP